MKTNIKIISGVAIGVVLSTTLSYCLAETLIDSKNVYYKDNSELLADNVQDAIDGTCTKFESKVDNFLDKIYPVGSIYISTTLDTTTKVGEALGGKWETYGAGRTLVGVGNNGTSTYTVGTTGGNENISLTVDNLPNHNHSIPELSGTAEAAGAHTPTGTISWKNLVGKFWNITYQEAANMGTATGIVSKVDIGDTGIYSTSVSSIPNADGFQIDASHDHTFTGTAVGNHTHKVTTEANNTGTTGKGTSFNIQNPYITVYMYKRTA